MVAFLATCIWLISWCDNIPSMQYSLLDDQYSIVVAVVMHEHVVPSMLWLYACPLVNTSTHARTYIRTHTNVFANPINMHKLYIARCLWQSMSMILVACIWLSVLCHGKIIKRASPGKLTLNQALAVALSLTNPHSLPH